MIATTLILLLVLIGLSIPVGAALGVLGLILDPLYSFLPLTRAMGELAWSTNNEFLLVAIPLFILLGEVLLRAGFAERMYSAMSLWLSWLPGGLMHANIGASALFAATSGSSVATAATVGVTATWGERLRSLVHLAPPLGIFLLVVGSIYAGLATPTEAAALGVTGALILAAWFGRLSLSMLREAVEGTMKASAMIMLIIIAAGFLNFVMSATGITDAVVGSISGLGLSPVQMLVVIVIFYLILGCFMETLSMMITTIPIVAPIMIALGYDPIWLGILIIILVEAALITPPVGLNLFVVQSLRKSGSMGAVIVGSIPFVLAMGLLLVLISLFPDLCLLLPRIFS
ncbi:MAG: hypothetical protein B7Y84_03005 [Azorhizobium sp. 32-67-21]|nr:MAG: hypothetical protein B7Y84_03005 [Azorhizobium sp. 32-67-21]